MCFVSIDVETANPNMSSICQIGLALYKDKKLEKEWMAYIDPQDYFDPLNISIHGIDEKTVKSAPTIENVADIIFEYLDKMVVISHTHFDRVALTKAFEKNNLILPDVTWLDSARVARRTWTEFAWKGYGLSNICNQLGYNFKHHDALEDAKAAGHIMLCAMKLTNIDINGWLKRVRQPIVNNKHLKNGAPTSISQQGNPEGDLYGEILVFTGSLLYSRAEAAIKAADIGCKVETGVNKKTTILVVGDQDLKRLAGHNKSSKHRKAENLKSKGQKIKIIQESDFLELIKIGGHL